MKTKRMISLLLAVLLTLSVAVTPAFAASAGDLLPAAESADVEESNDVVSIRLTTSGELVYGSPFTLSVVTKPADTQYIGVVIGEEEYIAKDGTVKVRPTVRQTRSVDSIRNGDFKVPDVKRLSGKPSPSGATEGFSDITDVKDDLLPWF